MFVLTIPEKTIAVALVRVYNGGKTGLLASNAEVGRHQPFKDGLYFLFLFFVQFPKSPPSQTAARAAETKRATTAVFSRRAIQF